LKQFHHARGHPGSEFFQTPYVAFFCKSSKIKELCKILNQAEKQEQDQDNFLLFDLSVNHSNDVHGCQSEARRGWIALDLQIEVDSATIKKRTFALLTDLFQQQHSNQPIEGANP
jgi:hypothetical protein